MTPRLLFSFLLKSTGPSSKGLRCPLCKPHSNAAGLFWVVETANKRVVPNIYFENMFPLGTHTVLYSNTIAMDIRDMWIARDIESNRLQLHCTNCLLLTSDQKKKTSCFFFVVAVHIPISEKVYRVNNCHFSFRFWARIKSSQFVRPSLSLEGNMPGGRGNHLPSCTLIMEQSILVRILIYTLLKKKKDCCLDPQPVVFWQSKALSALLPSGCYC